MTLKTITTPAVPEPPGGICSDCLEEGGAGMTAGGLDGKALAGADVYEPSEVDAVAGRGAAGA